MNISKLTYTLLIGGAVLFTASAISPVISTASAQGLPTYNPPAVEGAPARRVGGGTRGFARGIANQDAPTLALLAPNSIGYTLEAQPTLYWSAAGVAEKPLLFSLNYADPMSAGHFEPLLEVPFSKVKDGIYALDLKQHGITLEAGVEYETTLTAVMNEDGKPSSADVVATGLVQRVEAAQLSNLPENLTELGAKEKTFALASSGVWYDAVASLSSQIEAQPEDKDLRSQRAGLLNQVGLGVDVAEDVEFVYEIPKS